jgi:hypothetical protein
MLIRNKSIISGEEREMDLPITEEQLNNWKNGMLIQNAMPNLTPAQREFLISGITPEEWDEFLNENDYPE